MSSCWSCLVILEPGVTVCPLCGADQSRPVAIVNPDAPQPVTAKSFLQHWGMVIVTVVVFAGTMTGILWHNLAGPSISPSTQAAEVAAKSLRDLREALSTYVISTKDSYPSNLNPLGDRVGSPMQSALSAGYRLEYTQKPPATEGAPRGFVILARPEKIDCPSLYIDESGVVRASQENHSASAKDPPF